MKTQLPVVPMVPCVRVPARWSTRPVVLAATPTATSFGATEGFAVIMQMFAGTVFMVAVPAVGMPADQFPAVFQSVLVPPTHVDAVAKAHGTGARPMTSNSIAASEVKG